MTCPKCGGYCLNVYPDRTGRALIFDNRTSCPLPSDEELKRRARKVAQQRERDQERRLVRC